MLRAFSIVNFQFPILHFHTVPCVSAFQLRFLPFDAGLDAVRRADPFVGGVDVMMELGGPFEPTLGVGSRVAPGDQDFQRVALRSRPFRNFGRGSPPRGRQRQVLHFAPQFSHDQF